MNLEPFEKLEKTVHELLDEVRRLRAENLGLKNQVEELEQKLNPFMAREDEIKAKLNKLSFLEVSYKKTESEKMEIRGKVQQILDDLEKMNFT